VPQIVRQNAGYSPLASILISGLLSDRIERNIFQDERNGFGRTCSLGEAKANLFNFAALGKWGECENMVIGAAGLAA
jgi:hypothetical protein